MALTEKRIAELKLKCAQNLQSALGSYEGKTVAALHKKAIAAAEKIRGKNDEAFVAVSIDNDDDFSFKVIVDITSDKGDSFYFGYDVVASEKTVRAYFSGGGDIKDA